MLRFRELGLALRRSKVETIGSRFRSSLRRAYSCSCLINSKIIGQFLLEC